MSNFPLRLPKDLMEDAKIIAKDQGVSVNQFLATVLAERVGEMKAMARLRHRAPDVAPMIGDDFLVEG
jgi:hypothetical protein